MIIVYLAQNGTWYQRCIRHIPLAPSPLAPRWRPGTASPCPTVRIDKLDGQGKVTGFRAELMWKQHDEQRYTCIACQGVATANYEKAEME